MSDIDLSTARTEAEWLARLDELGDELGCFTPLGAHHAAFFADGDDTLIVSFETIADCRATGPDHKPLGLLVAEAHGWSHLGLIARAPRWYRDREVLDFFDAQIDEGFFESFKRVLFYGAGMAGYAACAFSLTAPGATVLAIAPQATIDPEIAPWDHRFTWARRLDFRTRFGFAPDMLDGSRNAFVLYDPAQTEDSMHAALFRRPFVHMIRSPNLFGPTPQALARMGLLTPLIELAAVGRLTGLKAANLLRKRHDDPTYLRALTHAIAKTERPGLTAIAARRAMERRRPAKALAEPVA
ncbi:phosphoadenosine phosphosulfate reductase [Roseibaca sp. Y0-43]|uniref:phosphoadenosine phosphosulfate reductase n=1 Tax=Roseibaca sp. Y0-43 TaxID=2816854 RepID=UPI001D0CC81E|nr:phosphoadenosine phosphosulfate reductase [Roseibaca sp. Y0-43]MCC1480578.1 phosphoadenosine phosphosulfate reductase [Roseibaca sp. Y0-43]